MCGVSSVGSGSRPVVVAVVVVMVWGAAIGREVGYGGNADSRTAEQPGGQDSSVDSPPVISLLGEELTPVPIDPERREELEANLAKAKAAFDADPTDEDAIIWYGRRLAYLGRYREAIDVYWNGLLSHYTREERQSRLDRFDPAHHLPAIKLSRHLGHRYITVRELDRAVRELGSAANAIEGMEDEVEPDGMPNAAGVPTGTLHTNIRYHLGLALYLRGEFRESRYWYMRCLNSSTNDDMRVAASYWLYLNHRRLGDEDAAKAVLDGISAEMEIIENHTYHRLLLLFKGEIKPEEVPGTQPSAVGAAVDDATMAYGVAMWHLLAGREEEARARFERIAGKDRAVGGEGGAWAAFGYIAAEAELAREQTPKRRQPKTPTSRHVNSSTGQHC